MTVSRHQTGGSGGRSVSQACRIDLTETGRFWLPVDKTFPLAAVAEAHRISEHGHVRGRLVLVVS